MDSNIGIVKVSADQLLQDSADATALARKNKHVPEDAIVLKTTSFAALQNIPSKAGFTNMPTSTGRKSLSWNNVMKTVSGPKSSNYSSSFKAFNEERASRQSGFTNFKVFSSNG